jgi:hypothetical protein
VTLSTEAARGDYDWRSQYSAEELVPLGWQLKTSRTSGAPYYLEFWSNHVQEEDPRSPICLNMSSIISIVSAGWCVSPLVFLKLSSPLLRKYFSAMPSPLLARPVARDLVGISTTRRGLDTFPRP